MEKTHGDSLPGLFLPTGKYHTVSLGKELQEDKVNLLKGSDVIPDNPMSRAKIDPLNPLNPGGSGVVKPSILQGVASQLGLSVPAVMGIGATVSALFVTLVVTLVVVASGGGDDSTADPALVFSPSPPSPLPPTLSCPTWSVSPSTETRSCQLGGTACSMGQYDGYMVAAPAGTLLVGSGYTTACSLV